MSPHIRPTRRVISGEARWQHPLCRPWGLNPSLSGRHDRSGRHGTAVPAEPAPDLIRGTIATQDPWTASTLPSGHALRAAAQ